jgi:hypothetical protein
MDKADKKLVRKMTKRVGGALRHARERGMAQSKQGPGQFMLWEIVR